MSDLWWTLAVIFAVIFGLPTLVFLIGKAWRMGNLVAEKRFREKYPNQPTENKSA